LIASQSEITRYIRIAHQNGRIALRHWIVLIGRLFIGMAELD
jgi:hypothetical protein